MEASYEEKRTPQRGVTGLDGRLEQICIHLLFAALGALLGNAKLLFEVRPFGLSLCAAVAGRLFPATALGALAFALWRGDYLSALGCAAMALCRLGFSFFAQRAGERTALFEERAGFRVVSAALSSLLSGSVAAVRGEFKTYYLLALLLGVAVSALAAWVLCGLFLPREALFPYSREAGLGALVLLGIFAMRAVSFAGIYPAAVCGALVGLWLAAHYGAIFGALGGLFCGLCFGVIYAPAFLFYALCFALLQKSSRGGGILAGCGAAALYAFAASGSEGLVGILPSLLTAGALFLAGDSFGVIEGSPVHREAMRRRLCAAQAARDLQAAHNEARMRDLSGALGELSGILYQLGGKQRRPGQLDLRHLCDREFDKVCPSCSRRDICWGSEYRATAETVATLGARLYQKGRVERAHVPTPLAARCIALDGVLERINSGAQFLFEEALRGDKTTVVASDFAAMGRMMSDTLEVGHTEFEQDEALSERLAACLQRRGYTLESACVCGTTHRRVLLRDLKLPGRHIKVRELRGLLEQVCKCELGEAEVKETGGKRDYLFAARVRFCAQTVKHSRAKNAREGGYCGDSVTALEDGRGKSIALLCDGMGSGNAAALCSALSSTVLSRLLQAGNRADTSLRMLNGVLCARAHRENEASTTVDLLEIDGVCGTACFYKCGAAPSYLLREGRITRFFSRTAPVGILEALDAERISFEVQSGDVILQVSDGVTGGDEDCPWLADMLQNRWDGEADKFARLVLNHAGESGGDDLSVMITEIFDAPAPGAEVA